MTVPYLPDQVSRIEAGESFFFLCHKDVSCFTECCRELELALTPYDVLRLRWATGLTSDELHQRYIIEENHPARCFPEFYLSMVDDGRASCVFVTPHGCSVYQNRPGACRTYPLGRGVTRHGGTLTEQFILLREPHCRGFDEKCLQTVQSFTVSQGLEPYNRFNDMLTGITQHERIGADLRLSAEQYRLYKLALFNLDSFRRLILEDQLEYPLEVPDRIVQDDELLLGFGMRFVKALLLT